MPTNRRPRRRPENRKITPAVLAWYAKVKEIRSCGDDDFWEEEGGRRREYLDTITLLNRALGIPIWSADFLMEKEFAPLVRELESAARKD